MSLKDNVFFAIGKKPPINFILKEGAIAISNIINHKEVIMVKSILFFGCAGILLGFILYLGIVDIVSMWSITWVKALVISCLIGIVICGADTEKEQDIQG